GPIGLVGPRMIWAAKEPPGAAARRADDARPLVRTAVHQHAHRSVFVPDHDQRLARDLVGEIVAGLRHLAVVADVVPGVGEEMLPLESKDLLVYVEVPVHTI